MAIDVVTERPDRALREGSHVPVYQPSDLAGAALRHVASILEEDVTLGLDEVVGAMVARQILALSFSNGEALWQPVAGFVQRAVRLDIDRVKGAVNGETSELFNLGDEPELLSAEELARSEDREEFQGPNSKLLRLIRYGDSGILRAAHNARVRPFNPFEADANEPVEHDLSALRMSQTGYGSAARLIRDSRRRLGRIDMSSDKSRRGKDSEYLRKFGYNKGAPTGLQDSLEVLAQRPDDVAVLVRSMANAAFGRELAERSNQIVVAPGGWGGGGFGKA